MAGWIVKSISWKGRDMTYAPFDTAASDEFPDIVVTVTNAVPALSGAVRDSGDLKRSDATVVVFPTEREQWRNAGLYPARMRTTTVASDGTYTVSTLPAGSYFVAAIPSGYAATWQDPDFLARVERVASTVVLAWGGHASLDVTALVVK